MVSRLHDAGIEVILDVVYNHTAEGNELGPTLSFRGIDNKSYYRLEPTTSATTIDYTGCGNSLNLDHPRVLQDGDRLAALLGATRCTSTAFVSTSRRRWRDAKASSARNSTFLAVDSNKIRFFRASS